MGPEPDFEALRAERNRKRREQEAQWEAEGYTILGKGCAYHADDACYCDCPDGPCEHKWDGKTWESEDKCAMSVTCSRCGMTSMSHSMRVGP